jgi:hypothetical protein
MDEGSPICVQDERCPARAHLVQPADMAPEPYLCIKPACGNDCSGCNNAISPQTMRDYAIAHAAVLAAQPAPVPDQPQGEPYAHIISVVTDAGPTKMFTAPSDPRGFPVYLHPAAPVPVPVPVPPGWKLVPVKPTPEMRQAALEMSRGWHPTGCEPMPHAYEIWASDLVYRAMIAASPEKP